MNRLFLINFNHKPEASDLHAFRDHDTSWISYAGKPIKNAVYRFHKTIVK